MEGGNIVIVSDFGFAGGVKSGHGICEFVFLAHLIIHIKVEFCKAGFPLGETGRRFGDVHEPMKG